MTICVETVKQAFWRYKMFFWPVYAYWLVFFSHPAVSVWLFWRYLDPQDEASQLLAVHHPVYIAFLYISLQASAGLTVLFSLFLLYRKEWSRAGWLCLHLVMMGLLTPLLWQYLHLGYVQIVEGIMEPGSFIYLKHYLGLPN